MKLLETDNYSLLKCKLQSLGQSFGINHIGLSHRGVIFLGLLCFIRHEVTRISARVKVKLQNNPGYLGVKSASWVLDLT